MLTRRFYGVDFSGARDAGRRTWITSGLGIDGMLRIDGCLPASELPGSSVGRGPCLEALGAFVADQPGAVFGFDFPFGLPHACVAARDWTGFVRSFRRRFRNADTFKRACWTAAGGRECRRLTDRESRTPFCAYNLRLYRQTYHGIRDLLAILVTRGGASVLPMQEPRPGTPLVIEICPASTLRGWFPGLREPYKGRTSSHRRARARILRALEATGIVRVDGAVVKRSALVDPGGDALDSFLAAFAAFQAARTEFATPGRGQKLYRLEGYVYGSRAGGEEPIAEEPRCG